MPVDRPPLLLLHGISSRETVFWHPARQCLGRFLEPSCRLLTGRLRWGRPAAGGRGGSGNWDFDAHLAEDLPAIWAEACAVAGRPPAVLGYSMGGMLALLAQARGLIAAPALVLLAVPVAFPAIAFYPPLMRRVYDLARRWGWPRIPTRLLGRLVIWLFAGGRPSRIGPGLRLFHAQIRGAGVDVPPATLGQATAWVETGRFCDRTGRRDLLSELGGVAVPALFLAGSADRIAPPEVMRRGFETVSSAVRRFEVIAGGDHLNLVNGPLAAEVAMWVTRWLDGHLAWRETGVSSRHPGGPGGLPTACRSEPRGGR
ncbi:MAG: alpha/beta hydrolase [Candidatus Riflebacteria bacterium]|nr:alpha/beta hydrolase [Candidatus Riflebacteria bacterium]